MASVTLTRNGETVHTERFATLDDANAYASGIIFKTAPDTLIHLIDNGERVWLGRGDKRS